MFSHRSTGIFLLLLLSAPAGAQNPHQPQTPYPYRLNEPKAKSMSLEKANAYVDGVARFWMTQNSCGACHANYSYLMMPASRSRPAEMDRTRRFLETRETKRPIQFVSGAETAAIALALVWDDRATAGRLSVSADNALTRMWNQQQPSGSWRKLGCGEFPSAENDGYYTATLAALAAGMAPDGYAGSPRAQKGIATLRNYFGKTPPPNLHHQGMLLWASLYLDGLMTKAKRDQTIKDLLSRQSPDGGWNLQDLQLPLGLEGGKRGPNLGLDPSDGYSTAFVLYVLRQAHVSPSRPEIVRGVRWLTKNQRESGRWFTPSPAAGDGTGGGVGTRDLYIQNMGTTFAILALDACTVDGNQPPPRLSVAGLSLRERLIGD
jgi:squalene-hopene/tetraprenyl-beta-curcumene cyclase